MREDGKTIGAECFYCTKHFTGKVKPSTTFQTMQEYKNWIADGIDRVRSHHAAVDALVRFIAQNPNANVDWLNVEDISRVLLP